MLRNFLILGLLIFLTQCGRQEPSIEGIAFPATVTDSSNTQLPTKARLAVAPETTTVVIENGVKILNAPLVLLRGEIEQYQTEMTEEPGS